MQKLRMKKDWAAPSQPGRDTKEFFKRFQSTLLAPKNFTLYSTQVCGSYRTSLEICVLHRFEVRPSRRVIVVGWECERFGRYFESRVGQEFERLGLEYEHRVRLAFYTNVFFTLNKKFVPSGEFHGLDMNIHCGFERGVGGVVNWVC